MFKRFKQRRVSPLESELTAERPEPSARLVHSIVALLNPRGTGSRAPRLRLGYAGALTAALVGVLAATGGFAYAASAVQRAAHAVHITSSKPRVAASAAVSSACSQYAMAPVVTGVSPSTGKVGSTVTITGSHFSGNSAVTSVTFSGGASASFTVVNDTTIKATVPAGAQNGPITVSNCKGSASTGTFKVIPPGHHKKPKCDVPNVKGKSVGAAKSSIARHHCKPGKITKVNSSKRNKNRVIGESPHPGKRLKNGAHVNLVVGK